MRICCDLSGKRRPQEFESPAGTRRFLATYRRVTQENGLSSIDEGSVLRW